ncbi:MAG: Anion-transporting ATPase [Frankiales bacterium]|nr:Anion-transporting ATPase [Frankiales bacterium]
MPRFPDVRLHVVTGKGGTGKTTVSAALALALAAGGKRVLLAEVEGRQGLTRLFDAPALTYEERRIARAADGGEVYAIAIDPEPALVDYLAMFYRAGVAGGIMRRLGLVEFATTIAPGIRDVLLTGKVREATDRRRPTGVAVYDAVVLDAPPTGRIGRFLGVTEQLSGLTRTGPIRRHADTVAALLRSPATAVHIVTLLEDMPVQETLDAVAELRAGHVHLGAVFINQALPPVEDDASGVPSLMRVRQSLSAADVQEPALAGALVELAKNRRALLARQSELRGRLAQAGLPLLELPALPDAAELSGVYGLSELLHEEWR